MHSFASLVELYIHRDKTQVPRCMPSAKPSCDGLVPRCPCTTKPVHLELPAKRSGGNYGGKHGQKDRMVVFQLAQARNPNPWIRLRNGLLSRPSLAARPNGARSPGDTRSHMQALDVSRDVPQHFEFLGAEHLIGTCLPSSPYSE
jgi:hypothetical protein